MIPRKIQQVHDITSDELRQLQTRVRMLEELVAASFKMQIEDRSPAVNELLMRLSAYGLPAVWRKLGIIQS